MNEPKRFGALTSSTDPDQLSLSFQSAAKVIIGIIGAYAAYKGLDQTAITSNLQQFVAIIVTLIPIAFSTYHTLELAWGLLRKAIVAFYTPKPTV